MLFIELYKVLQAIKSVDEILKCEHSNESYLAVVSCVALYYAVKSGSNYCDGGWDLWLLNWSY